MRKINISFLLLVTFLLLLGTSMSVPMVYGAGEGAPTQEEAFDNHTFDENYWDILVFNNSNWEHEAVNKETSWLNNTWNIKWIKEGNFEMGMLAFMNKTQYQDGKEITYTTPAQMWWQHASKAGGEIFIGSMHCAWFGFDDQNQNRYYDVDLEEEISPFFYMGMNSKEMVEDVGIYSTPKASATPLERSVNGANITYTWSYKYENIIFFVPQINHTGTGLDYGFEWGFNYSDPGTYIDGSHHIGNQSYIQYDYSLEINTNNGEAHMFQDYHSGAIDTMMYKDNEFDPWQEANYLGPRWVPKNWSMCLGTWSFIIAGQDPALTDPIHGDINANVTKTGLTTVKTEIGGVHAFDFAFEQKPNYSITNKSGTPADDTFSVVYECLATNESQEFINFVSGMLHLVGDFGRVVLAYAINQTNTFTNGISYTFAYENLEPDDLAAFFISCYPEFGKYGGGELHHDPTFVMYFDPADQDSDKIPGYTAGILIIALGIGTVIVLSKRGIKVKRT